MWPRDAYVGQFVAPWSDWYFKGMKALEKGRVYTIASVTPYFNDVIYFTFSETGSELLIRYDLVKPLDESRLDVFRAILKRTGVWEHADA